MTRKLLSGTTGTDASRKVARSAGEQWTRDWLSQVAAGASTMSQRRVKSVEEKGGGIPVVAAVARELGIHVVRLVDDRGNDLLAVSPHPFTVIS